ncbi:FG-GAP-like repeat-containing protein [Candidatus Palauibacter sp.]|uniref:FG-GAP-like repeat-containing protein n=1 Tax=Candidatus Palauibacter sp. TaxID=3101350 RepID=UPI003C6F413E
MSRPRIQAAHRRASCALLATVAACGPADFAAPAQPGEWTEVSGARWRTLAVEGGDAGFTSISPSWSGVDFANALTDSSFIENQMRGNGSGVAAGDVNGDGRPDFYLARLEGPNALYINLGDWRFREEAVESGVDAADRFSTGATLVDVDGDDDHDLILTSIEGPRSVFLNDGEGRFAEAPGAGLLDSRGGTSSALADIDGDGDLDLYLTRYKSRSVLDLFPGDEVAFPNTVRRVGRGFEVVERFADHYELAWRADGVVRLEKGESDELYLNEGGGRFRHVPFSSGAFLDPEGAPLEAAPTEWGLAARFGDLDSDGDPDLYVANDLHSPDRLWINQGDGTFRLPPSHALPTTSASSMAVDFADFDRDGDADVFVLDMLARDSRSRKTQDPVSRVEQTPPGEASGAQQVNRNTLLANRGDGTWAEIGRQAGVEASGWSWSALFLDVDLDGFEDLLIPNGHIRDLMDADTQIRIREAGLSGERESTLLYRPLPLRNVAFRNLGGRGFEEVGGAWGVAPEPDVSHGAALADFDGDGDLDAVVNRLDSPALLLRNDAASPRLAVRLRGEAPNTAGIGATVWLEVAGLPRQTKEIAAGGGYLSGSEALVSFAMGEASEGTLGVDWRGGGRSVVRVDGPDRLYEVPESEASRPDSWAGTEAATGTRAAAAPTPDATPWFELDESFGPIHDEPPFAEVTRQPLLPLRLSRMGPSVAWHDLDGDGDPDLLLGSGASAAPVLFRNDGGALVRVTLAGPRAPIDQTAVIPLPVADTARVLFGLSSYEAPAAEVTQVPAVVSAEWSGVAMAGVAVTPINRGVAPGTSASVGVLAVADYDLDGRLDLFAGARVVPGAYPMSGPSRVFRGRPGGGFEEDRRDAAVFERLGMVTGAVFTDYDADGAPDLAVSVDWGPVRLLRNDRGRFSDVTDEVGLHEYVGRWNGVSAGDFDGDGLPDLVAVSWGDNTEYRPTPGAPLELFFGDVDLNGTLDLVAAQRDERLGGVAPLAALGRLAEHIPPVGQRMPTRADYAEADVGEALGAWPEGRLKATELRHMLFLNRGDAFEAVPLPLEAQRAPSLGLLIADANGDGREDLFLSQNFFATDEDTPRYDAGRGLWLEGDGRGGFRPVPGLESGVAAYGDQRGVAAADIDSDGRLDFVLGINGGAARLFRGAGNSPGLRVRLAGPAGNRHGIGAVLRVAYADGMGPAREVRAGSGTGSHDDPVQIMGLSGYPVAVEVRWPGGVLQRVEVPPGAREVTVGPP